MSDLIYREIILDHYKNPRNFGSIDDADATMEESNVTCGDKVKYFVKIQDGIITDIKFVGRGCAISMASSSILTELVKGKSVDDVIKMTKDDLIESLGNPILGPNRIKCAVLPYKVLKSALIHYISEHQQKS